MGAGLGDPRQGSVLHWGVPKEKVCLGRQLTALRNDGSRPEPGAGWEASRALDKAQSQALGAGLDTEHLPCRATTCWVAACPVWTLCQG